MTAYDRSAPLDEDDKPDSGVALKGATPLSRLSRMFFRPCFVPSGFLLLVLLSCLFSFVSFGFAWSPPPHFRLLDRLSHPRHPVPSRSSSVTVLCFPLFCPLSLSVLPLLLSPLFLLLRSLVRCSLLPSSFSPRSFRRFLRRLTSRPLLSSASALCADSTWSRCICWPAALFSFGGGCSRPDGCRAHASRFATGRLRLSVAINAIKGYRPVSCG